MPKQISDIDLMMLADGELDADEARELSEQIESDEHAQLKTRSLEQIRDGVRTYLELSADAAADEARFDGMWDRIERRIHTNGAKASPAAAPVERKKPGVRAEPSPGFMQALRDWFGGWRGHIATGLATAGAVAVLMVLVRPFERVVERRVEVVTQKPEKSTKPEPEITHAVAESQPPEVEDLEVYNGSGMILTIPGDSEDESSTTVIWLSRDDAVEEDPI